MDPTPPRSTAARTAIGRAHGRHRALLIATCTALIAASIADAATGYDGPGPFIYPAFALAVALAPWRYTPLLAAAMSAFFIVGGLASASFAHRLTTPSRLLDFTADWAQLLSFAATAAFATASVACAASRTPTRPTLP
jgi:hypothetical protein